MKSLVVLAILFGAGSPRISLNQDRASSLARQLKSSDPKKRLDAVKALYALGPRAAGAADALLDALTGDDPKIRRTAARTLSEIGRKGVKALVTALNHSDKYVRREAARAFLHIDPPAEDAVPALVKTLRDSDLKTARYAARGIGRMGLVAASAEKSLVLALEDERLSPWAARALIQVAPAQTQKWVKRLPEFLGNSDSAARYEAATALVAAGPLAKDALPELLKALKDKNSGVRAACAQALGGLGSLANSAVPGLVGALTDESASVRHKSARALGAIGPAALEAIPSLKRAMEDSNGAVALASKNAVALITSPEKPKVAVAPIKPDADHGMPKTAKILPPHKRLPAILSRVSGDLVKVASGRTKQCVVFVVDDSMGKELEVSFLEAWRKAFSDHPLRKENRFYAGIVVLSSKPYVALRPTNNLDKVDLALKKLSLTKNNRYKNTMEAVRLAAVLARNVSGTRAVILYSQDNADSEDHLELTLKILKAGKTKFYSITPEAAYSDHYWKSYGYEGKRTKIIDPVSRKPIDLGFGLHGEESPLIEFPFQWIYTGIFPRMVPNFGTWDGDSPLLVPSGFPYYAPARLAKETGGKSSLCPNAQSIPSFCLFVDCPTCKGEHDACYAVFDETKVGVTAPSLQSRADYVNRRNVGSLQALVVRTWWEAHRLNLVTAVPPVKISARNGLSLTKSSPKAEAQMITEVPWFRAAPYSLADWRLLAGDARTRAQAAGKLIDRVEGELGKADRATVRKRWLATAEALRVCLMVSRMNLLLWAEYCLEQKEGKRINGIRMITADPGYSFCHGGNEIEGVTLYGGESLRRDWKALCAAVDDVAGRHRGTPWEMLVRRTLILKWGIKVYLNRTGGGGASRGLTSRGRSTSGTSGAPTRPGRSARGGSSTGSTRSGGGRP